MLLAPSDFALRVAQTLENRFLDVMFSLKLELHTEAVSLSMTDLIKKWTGTDYMHFSLAMLILVSS